MKAGAIPRKPASPSTEAQSWVVHILETKEEVEAISNPNHLGKSNHLKIATSIQFSDG